MLESSKFLLSITKVFLFQAKICLRGFLVGKKWLIWRTSKILLERSKLLLVLIFFLKIRNALFALLLDTRRKLNVHKTFRRRLNVLYAFNLLLCPGRSIYLDHCKCIFQKQVAQRWYSVNVWRWSNVETTLHNVVSILFPCSLSVS